MIKYNFQATTAQKIGQNIIEAMADKIKKSADLTLRSGSFKTKVSKAIENELNTDGIINAFMSDTSLASEWGVSDLAGVVKNINSALSQSIQFELEKVYIGFGDFSLSLKIMILRKDYKEALSVGGTHGVNNGTVINWLDWILFRGDDIIIIDIPDVIDVTRSNEQLLRVPAQYSGQAHNNMFTRALANIHQKIGPIIETEIKRNIRNIK